MDNRFVVRENFVDEETNLEESRTVAVFKHKYDAMDFMRNNTLYDDETLEMIEVDASPEYTLFEGYNVSSDMLQNVLNAIYENGLQNHSMLREYISGHGEYYGIDSVRELEHIVKDNVDMIQLAFEGERHEHARQLEMYGRQ